MKEINFLVVEDELLIAELIKEILEEAGYTDIRTATTVNEAVSCIESERPSLVITDVNLNEKKSGLDLGKLLNEIYKIPFVYLTSHSSKEIVSKAKHTVPNAFIVKPFKKEDILVAIELALFNNGKRENGNANDVVFKEGHSVVRLSVSQITWLETEGNYVTIHLIGGKRRVIRATLTEIQQKLNSDDFVRIHKSYVVHKKHVTEIRSAYVVVDSKELPIGRTYQPAVSNMLD